MKTQHNTKQLNASGTKLICIRITPELYKLCKKAKIKPSAIAREAIYLAVTKELGL